MNMMAKVSVILGLQLQQSWYDFRKKVDSLIHNCWSYNKMEKYLVFTAEIWLYAKEGQTLKALLEQVQLLGVESYMPISELADLGSETLINIDVDSIRNENGGLII